MLTDARYVNYAMPDLGPQSYTLSFEVRAESNLPSNVTAQVLVEWIGPSGVAQYVGTVQTTSTGTDTTAPTVSTWTTATFDLDPHIGGREGMLRLTEVAGSGGTARVRRLHITDGASGTFYGAYPRGYALTAGVQDGAGVSPGLGEMGDATDTQYSARAGTVVATPLDALTFLFGRSSYTEPSSPYAAEVLADSPSLYWRLGDTPASAAVLVYDSSGSGHHGKIQGSLTSPTFGTTGLLSGDPDTCASFNNSAIEVPYGSWLSPSLFTVEAVIQTSLTTGNQIFLDRDDGGTGAVRVFQMYRAATVLGFYLIGSTPTNVTGSATIADGTPHHVAVTFDGTTIKLYVDGTLDTSTAALSVPTGAAPFRVGANRSGPGGSYVIPFTGEIDEAAYYPTALSGARIAAHAAAA